VLSRNRGIRTLTDLLTGSTPPGSERGMTVMFGTKKTGPQGLVDAYEQ
jgi:hypothetical protein